MATKQIEKLEQDELVMLRWQFAQGGHALAEAYFITLHDGIAHFNVPVGEGDQFDVESLRRDDQGRWVTVCGDVVTVED